MAKEYHITFSCGTEDDGAKMAINKVQRMMKEGGAELISKNDDYDGFVDIVFHQHTSAEKVSKLCNGILDHLKTSPVHFSAIVYEHKPSVLVDTKDVKDIEQFKTFVSDLASQHGYISMKPDQEDPSLLRVEFQKSSQRLSFQNDYTAKAGEQMKNGHSSVEVFPDWEDITILQRNSYTENKKTTKYGY